MDIPVHVSNDNRITTVSREEPKAILLRVVIKVQSPVNLKIVNTPTIEETNETTSDARDSTETDATDNKQRCPWHAWTKTEQENERGPTGESDTDDDDFKVSLMTGKTKSLNHKRVLAQICESFSEDEADS